MLTLFQLLRCLLFLLVLALACRTTSCFISDCPTSQVLSPDKWEQVMSFYFQGYYAKDSKRMFVGGGIKRMFIENKAKQKDIEKRNAKPPAILKARVNKRDLRFLYNILYNDKNKKQNCKLCCCNRNDGQRSYFSCLDNPCKSRNCATRSRLSKGLFLHLKK